MTCDRVKDLLPDKAARRLTPAQDLAVSSHLDTCPACAADLASLQATLDALDALPLPSPSAQVRSGLLAAIEAEKRAARAARPAARRTSLAGWLARAAAAAALVALGFLLGARNARPPAPSPAEVATQQQVAALQARVDSMTQLVGYTLSKGSTNDRIARVLTTAAVMKPDTPPISAASRKPGR